MKKPARDMLFKLILAALAGQLLGLGSGAGLAHADFAWRQRQADIGEQGQIRWSPRAFEREIKGDVRYIDFVDGDDRADGLTPRTAWQRHPWDPEYRGEIATATTYVFKRGVVYRGRLVAPKDLARPIQLTSDPAWGGEAEAVIAGSSVVTEWVTVAEHSQIPESSQLWSAKLDFAPRNVWMVQRDGSIVRLPLARTPNWRPNNLDDIKADWWTFTGPRDTVEVNGDKLNLGVDPQHLTLPRDAVEGAYVWAEYGWVMGTPYPSRVNWYEPQRSAIAVEGQWGRAAGGTLLPTYSRYYLEDRPHFLDDPQGEFWFDKQGEGGTLYVRLPDGVEPDDVTIEAAEHATLIDLTQANQLSISGLAFRFTNTFWDLHAGPYVGKDAEPAAIRLVGQADDIEIANCRFEHVNKAIRFVAHGDQAAIDRVMIRDNDIAFTDHGAIQLYDGSEWGQKLPTTRLLDVKVLRNRLTDVGHRPTRYGQGHAIDILCAQTAEVAGNVLDRLYGAGIFVYGGKRSAAETDRPLSRILIHQNQVTNPLLNNNDWGGIETWQAGPAYVYNNVSGNPGGFKLWGIKGQPDIPGSARFGHAYYMDGAFKQYYFNNIAWGNNNDPYSPLGNTAAFQEIHGFLDYVFNNTAYNFVVGSRRQSPAAGQNKYLGNLWQSIGHLVFRHGEPSGQQADPNAADTSAAASSFDIASNAYVSNLFSDLPDQVAVFEPSGAWHGSVDAFRAALKRRGGIGDVGQARGEPLLRDPEQHDFRPTAAARDYGVRVFVPWALYGVVGEWHFYRDGKDTDVIRDEHFHLAPYYVDREEYQLQPRFPLTLNASNADSFTAGPLEDWVGGSLKLDGNTIGFVSAESLSPKAEQSDLRLDTKPSEWVQIDAPDSIVPGEKVQVSFTLRNDPPAGQQIKADLHWGSTNGRDGGFNANGGVPVTVDGRGPYTFTFDAKDKNRLGKFTVAVYLSPDGSWEKRTETARLDIAKGVRLPEGGYRTPRIDRSNLLIEAYFKAEPGRPGLIVGNLTNNCGYRLSVGRDGKPRFEIAGEGESAALVIDRAVTDGQWHHVIVEADRKAKTLRGYLDGRAVADAAGLGSVSLRNDAPLYMGGSPDEQSLVGEFEFLRIATGTLEQAQTTIEELYAWQFDGPFLRDFTGRRTGTGRSAGAIDFVPSPSSRASE